MGCPEDKKTDQNLLTVIAVSTRDVIIILSAFALIGVLGVFIVQHYAAADDATTVLGVIIPAVSTIAGTAFGVAAGARAGAAAGGATAQAAQTQTEAVKAQAEQVAARLGELRSELAPVLEAASTKGRDLPHDQLQRARTNLENAEQSLRAAL